MARQTIVRLSSDLDGTPADETVSFSLDSRSYEIDLTADQAAELRRTLAPYVSSARSRRHVRRSSAGDDSALIRSWARENGYPVNERGRVPAAVREAYLNR